IGAGLIARIDEIGIDVPVLIFSAGAIFVATVLFGFFSAWETARGDVGPGFKMGARSGGGGVGGVGQTFILCAVSVVVVVFICASLLVKSFWRLTNVNPGFDPAHVQTFRLRLPDLKYVDPQMSIRAVRELRRRIGELPGVIRVGITSGIPLGRENEVGYWLEGQPEPANQLQWPVPLPDYFDKDP